MESIDDSRGRCIRRFGEGAIFPALREAFGQRPEWRDFGARQLSVLLYLRGYLSTPLEDLDVEAALPFSLENWEGAA